MCLAFHHLRKKISRGRGLVKKTICRAAKTYILDVTLVTGKERDMFKTPLFTYLGMGLCGDVVLQARATRQGHLASLRSLFLPIFGGSPFLTMGRKTLTPPSLLSSDDGILIPPDTMFDIPSGWRPPLVLPLSALSSSTGIWYGVGASILVSTGSAGSSGRGAEHPIRFAFFTQPCEIVGC